MAKIILNIELDSAKAQSGLDDLKKSLTTIADSLGKVKPNKDLTDQIKALSDYYKSLTEAAKKAAEQTQKQADADAKAAINAEKLAKAQHDKEAAASRAKKADEDAAAASARKEAAETRAAEAAEKHAAAQQKRADAAAKAAKKDEEEAKPLWDLEKAYASLYARITSAAEKYPVLADVMGRYGKEVKDTHDALVEYNRGRTDEIEDVDTLTERLKRLSASMASVVADTKEESEAFKSNQQEMDKWAKSLQKAETDVENMRIKYYNMLTAISNTEGRYPKGTFDFIKDSAYSAINSLNQLDQTQEDYLDNVENAKLVLKALETAFAGLKGIVDHVTPSLDTLGSKFGDLVTRYAKFYASSMLVRKPLQMIQDALSDVGETLVETENAVIELNRVLDDPQPAMEAANRLYDIAYQYGSTFENASQIAANFARAGKSWNESLQATEAALLAMNVAELNATEASDGLLSIIAQFDMETSDLIDVVDKLNKTADKNPVSTQKLLQAIQRAGSAAKNANVSFDQTLGLITAISEATNRSGQNIGTAINSLIQYSTKNVDTFATLSKESEEMVDRFKSGLASIVDVWNQVAIDIHNDKEARDNIISALGTDGLEELSSTLHDELGDLVSEIDGVYNVANTYRKNYFIALLDNMDRFATVQEQLTDYQGYSQSENEKYMETYTAKVNQLNDAWKKLANDEQGILGFKKGLVDAGIALVDIIEKGGGIKNVVIDIVALLGSITVFFNGAKIGKAIEGFLTGIKDTGTYIKETVSLMKDLPGLISRAREAQEAYNAAQEVYNALKARQATEEELVAAGVDMAAAAQIRAAESAAAWQAALGWISLAITAITLAANGVNAYVKAQKKSREETIAQGKETAETAKQIGELRAAMAKLNPESAEYRETEEKIVELLGDKKILLEDLTKGTEEYTEKVKELTDAELREAQYNAIQAQNAAEKDVKSAVAGYNVSTLVGGYEGPLRLQLFSAKSIEDQYKIYQDVTKKLIDLKREYVIASTSGDEKTAKSIQMSIDYYQKFVDETGTAFEEWKTAVENNTALARLALDQSAEEIAASLEKVPLAARNSQVALQAIAEENGMTLEEVRAAFERVGQGTAEALEEIPEAIKDIADMTEDELDELVGKITGTVSAYSAAADAIELVKKAQAEYAKQGQLSLETVEKLSKLGADWVTVLFDESGAVDVNSEAVGYLVEKYQEWLDESGYLIDTTSEVAEEMKDLSAQIDEVQSAIGILNAAQKEYDETGSISIDTLQKLLELDADYLALITDEEGQIRLNKDAVDDLVAAKKDLLNQLLAQQVQEYAVNKLHEYMEKSTSDMGDAAVSAAQKIELAALALSHFEGNEEGAKRAAEDFEEALHRLALHEGVLDADWEEDWVNDVKNFRSGLNSLYSATDMSSSGWESSSGSSGSSSSKSTKDEKLEELKAVVSLRESELTLMEHQGKSEEEQIAKIREIQSGLSAQADYLRSIGASQEEINKLSSEWWKWEEKINKFAEDRQKAAEEAEKERQKAEQEAKKAAEEAEKAAQKAEEEAKKAAEEAEKARIKALNDETARHKQVVSDLKAELNLWQKQGKSVSDQVEEMKKIQEGLHEEAEWLRHLQATEKDIAVTQAEIDALSAEWWDWQEKILKLYEDTLKAARDIELEAQQKIIDGILAEIKAEEEALDLEEKRLAVDKARANLEDAIAKAKLDYVQTVLSDYLTALSDAETLEQKQRAVAEAREKLVTAEREARSKAIIDAFKAEKDVKNDTLSIEEKRLAVDKARQALIDAENERTTRVYNESSGQWEHQANAKNVQTAQENLQKAVDALNAYVEEQAWKEVSEAVENGSVSEAEVLEILSKWAKEAYGNGSPEFVAKIQSAFRKAMGTAASPDSVSGQISAVDNAVKSLNDYLKAEAVKELKAYIAAGNTDAAGMKSILDKWLSMGEGGELYEWRDGLLDSVNGAIESGYYDDSKVQSQIQAVENAVTSLHDYLRNRFISEITELVKNGTAEEIRAAIEKWSEMEDFDLAPSDLDWATRAADAVEQKETTASMWEKAMSGDRSSGTINWVMARMKQNSAAWWEADKAGDAAEKKRLADENFALGTAMGWHRKENGHWYDEYDRQVYDKGGVLHGRGGIKATNRPEIILDPELTAKILRPGSEAQFRAFADAMHLMFERGGRTRADMPVIRNPSVTDSHNTSYTVNGIPIPAASAERYTVAELFRMLPMARS